MITLKGIKETNRPFILVINSPLFRVKNDKYDEDSLPPIGLGVIATALQDDGANVKLIDAVAENIPLLDLIEAVNTCAPDFVCINVFSTNLILVREFVESLDIKTHIIVGGLSTKDLRKEIFSWNTKLPIDVVHGDGENITPDIVKNSINQKPNIIIENRRFFQIDTQSVYYVSDISIEKLNRRFFVNEPIIHPFGFKEAAVVTSRGCIYNCAFCAAAQSVNRPLGIREKSSESIIREIEQITQLYPEIDSIRVLDDLFLKNKQTIEKAIEVFSHFDIHWRAMAHVETFKNVDDDMAKRLKGSGCKELFFGIESGSPRILKMIHKCSKIEKIKASIELLLRNGIDVKGYFIYGFPSETEKDFKMTYDLALHLSDFAKKNGTTFRTSVFQYRPYHGTELYHLIEEEKKSEVKVIDYIKPNSELSDTIGRLQFNFHSGNYSAESVSVVQDYILRTTKLNSLRIFVPYAGSKKHTESNRKMQRLSAS